MDRLDRLSPLEIVRIELIGVAVIGAGEIAYDWPTHNWPELPWQLGGFAIFLLAVLLWPYLHRGKDRIAPEAPT